jgi:hypothetical protein
VHPIPIRQPPDRQRLVQPLVAADRLEQFHLRPHPPGPPPRTRRHRRRNRASGARSDRHNQPGVSRGGAKSSRHTTPTPTPTPTPGGAKTGRPGGAKSA